MKTIINYILFVVKQSETIKEIDCRPSDAIAISLRTDSPILVSETLMNNNSISSEQSNNNYIPWQNIPTNQKKQSKFSIINLFRRLRGS